MDFSSIFATVVAAALVALKSLGVAGIVGLVGTGIEYLGEKFSMPKLVRVGQGIEAIAVDVPKFLRGSRATALQNTIVAAVLKSAAKKEEK